MLIAVINESTLVTDAEISLACQAIQIQLNLHCAPAWEGQSASIKSFLSSEKAKIPGYAWVASVLDNPTTAGALGYHSDDPDGYGGGLIDAFIFCQPIFGSGGVALYDASNPQNVSVSSVLSHEILEMYGDRFANGFSMGPQITQGNLYAQELCDPVQDQSYNIVVNGNNVSVSNFIFPAWLNPNSKLPENAPIDYLNKLTKPFTITSGGYMIVASINNEGQVTGQHIFGETVPQWRKDYVKNEFYRR
jgi:hypothetical protein